VDCYPNLRVLPEVVELALMFVPAELTPPVMSDAVELGVPAVIVFSAGFAETGAPGAAAQQALLDSLRGSSTRVIGPNCQGVVHIPNCVAATFSNGVVADRLPPVAPVAYVGQSGALGGSLFDMLCERGLAPAIWVSTGNQLDMTVPEVCRYLVDDDAVELLMVYTEQVPDGREWREVCERLASKGKRAVVLRGGRSALGRAAVRSHTGSLVGDGRAFELTNAAHGVVEVSDVDELVESVLSWRAGAARAGRRLAIVTTSGAAGGIATDWMSECGLQLSRLEPGTVEVVAGLLPEFCSVVNPVDVTVATGVPGSDGGPSPFQQVCETLARDPAVDQLLVILSSVGEASAHNARDALVAVAKEGVTPVHLVPLSSHDRMGSARVDIGEAGVAIYTSVSGAVGAISRWVPPGEVSAHVRGRHLEGAGQEAEVITEASAAVLLDRSGVGCPRSELVVTPEAARDAASRLGERVVLKVESPDIIHKTEIGAVRVGVPVGEVAATYQEIIDLVGRDCPDAQIHGILVQEMIARGVELLVAVQGPADGYPPVVTVGMGGTSVEVYADVVSGLAPLDVEGALGMLRRLRGWPLLEGYRGSPGADVASAAEAIAAVSALASRFGGRLIEMEINPLIVGVGWQGAVAADFMARLRPGTDEG
jgi:acyl-CoA synthetase (NDP forming)